MNLESPKVSVQKPDTELFEFFCDVKNYEQLMPESIQKFKADDDSFLFALKGMPEIRLKMQEQIPSSKVILGSTDDKFPFTLTINIPKVEENASEVHLNFDGQFNMMVAMMIKSPLQKFINTLSENIEKLK